MEHVIEVAVILYVAFGVVAGILKRGSGNRGPVLQQPRRPAMTQDREGQGPQEAVSGADEYQVSSSIDEDATKFDAASPKVFEDFAETAGDVELPDEEGMGVEGQSTGDDGEGVSMEGSFEKNGFTVPAAAEPISPKVKLEGLAAAVILSEILGKPRSRKPWRNPVSQI